MSRSAVRKVASLLGFAAAGALAACAAIMDAERPEVAAVTLSESSLNLEVEATQQLTATARDAAGNALAGRQVFWSSEDSTVVRVSDTGVVTGVRPGSARIAASVESKSGIASVVVVPKPVASVTIAPTSADLPVGGTLQLEVTLRDAGGSVLEGRQVRWESSAPGVVAVEENGRVRALAIGSATITASSEGREGTAVIAVTPGPPANLVIVSGNNQSAAVGTAAPQPLVVRVTDAAGNAVSGVAVTWTVTGGGGTLSAASTVTNTSGQASVGWSLGSQPGENTVRATVSGLSPVTFRATAVAGAPANLVIVSGNNQSTAVGTAAPELLVVRVTDAGGNPVSGVAVSWTVTAGGGTLSPQSAGTDAAGQASARWTMGRQVGQNTARASVSGLAPVTFSAVAVAGPPANLLMVSGNNQSATVGTSVPQPLVVRVTDAEGNSVSGVPVSWTVTGGGGTLNAQGTVTNAAGQASVGWTMGSQAGQNTARASVSRLAPVSFIATAVAGGPASLAILSGNDQTAPVRTAVSQPLVVRVTDASGNPVSGVAVSWTVTAGGGTLSPQSAVTNTAGQASAGWTLGSQIGGNSARATVSDLAPVTFSAVAVAGPPAAIQIVGGTNQVGAAGQTLPEPLVVRVADAQGNPVTGVRVTWTVLRGNGSVNPSASNTNAQGQASTYWTLGNGPPEQVVEARVGNLEPVVFIAFRGVLR